MRLLLPAAGALEAADGGARDEAVAVNAHERPGKLALERDQRFLDQVLFVARAHGDVLLLGPQKHDVAHRHQHDAIALRDRQVLARRARRPHQALAPRRTGSERFLQRRREAHGAHRFQEVIERVQLEGLDGMLVVRSDEHHRGRALECAHVARKLEPIHAGHADVEQQHLGAARRQSLERFDAVGRLARHHARHVARDVLQELLQALARRAFIVGKEYADHVRR